MEGQDMPVPKEKPWAVSHPRELARAWRAHLSHADFRTSLVVSIALLVACTTVSFYAGVYATERASNYVTDIMLSNIPVFDVDKLFVDTTVIFLVFVIGVVIMRPQSIPFTAASGALFYFTRAVFITLTHLGPFPDHAAVDLGTFVGKFIGGGDLFFSGHTGAPFLMALLFWEHTALRYVLLAWSLFFALIVLLGHLHYSIDVLSAYFITYTIFRMSEALFKKYRAIFDNGLAALRP